MFVVCIDDFQYEVLLIPFQKPNLKHKKFIAFISTAMIDLELWFCSFSFLLELLKSI
jgi:hypothetical protein